MENLQSTLHNFPDIPNSVSQATFAIATLFGIYSWRRCLHDPNPLCETGSAKTTTTSKDFLFQSGFWLAPATYRDVFAVAGLLHALFSLLPDAQRSGICPNYHTEGVNEAFFRWGGYTASILVVLSIAGYIRLRAFSNLGSSFTFHLTQPRALITTGLHRYVRHPSYTALIAQCVSLVLLLGRSRGLLGCWMPLGLLSRGIEATLLLWGGVVVPVWFRVRVEQEERMLRETFGAEWAEYCSRTQRFIPGIL